MKDTPRTDDALIPKNFGAYYNNSEGDGVTAEECVFDQLLALCRTLERENVIMARTLAEIDARNAGQDFLNEALNSGDGVYRP